MSGRALCAACTRECDGKGSKGTERTVSKMMHFVKCTDVQHDFGHRDFAVSPITIEDRWCLRTIACIGHTSVPEPAVQGQHVGKVEKARSFPMSAAGESSQETAARSLLHFGRGCGSPSTKREKVGQPTYAEARATRWCKCFEAVVTRCSPMI